MKILTIKVNDSREFDEREGWPQELRVEYDEAEIVLGIFEPWSHVVLKGPGDLIVTEARQKGSSYKLALGSPDESECESEGVKLRGRR